MENFEDFFYMIRVQPFYWRLFGTAFNSWVYRMTKLTDDDLINKVPENNLGIYSIFCDKSNWSYGNGGVMNFWNAINFGYIDMIWEEFDY